MSYDIVTTREPIYDDLTMMAEYLVEKHGVSLSAQINRDTRQLWLVIGGLPGDPEGLRNLLHALNDYLS